MDARDLRETGRRLERAFSEFEWRMDWIVLDREAFEPAEVRAIAVELRLACMGHTAVLSDFVDSTRHHEHHAEALQRTAEAMQKVFEGLVQLRIQLDRFEMSGRTHQLELAYYEFATRLRALLDAEDELVTNGAPRRGASA